MKRLIIFDFDGVLADTFDTFYPLMRDGMKLVGRSFRMQQYRDLFINNVHRGFKDLFKRDKDKYSKFLEFRNTNYDKYYYDKRHKAKLFPEALKFLKEASKNHILTITSSGRQKNVEDLLKKYRISNLFALIIANGAMSKTYMLEEIIGKFGARPKETIMITDTIGDIKTAKNLGLKTIAVTWGFQTEDTLESAKPTIIVNSFKELIDNL